MKKRYAAGLALALVGILSGCGQAKTQPADNTISITPVEQKTNGSQIDKSVKYEFSGNHADVNGFDFSRRVMYSMRNISLSLMRRHRNREILYSLRNLLR